jgi:hypothetical protein
MFPYLFAIILAVSPARGEELVPYQKLVGSTFVADLDGKPVTVDVVYDGVAASAIVDGLYKHADIKVKDKVFLVHHDPAGVPGQPVVAGAAVQAPFAISLPKAGADAILTLKPGTTVRVVGTAHKSVFGMMAVRLESLYVEATSITPVPAVAP